MRLKDAARGSVRIVPICETLSDFKYLGIDYLEVNRFWRD